MWRISPPYAGLVFVLIFMSALFSACDTTPPQGQSNCASWQTVSSPNPGNVGDQLSDIVALANDNIWTVGNVSDTSTSTDSQNLIERWNGKTWSVIPSQPPYSAGNDYPTNLLRISGSSANDLWVVGQGSQGFLEHWNGTSWNLIDNPVQPRAVYSYGFFSVTSLSSTDAWAVGQTMFRNFSTTDGNGVVALITHWDGKSWNVVPNPDLHADLNGTVLYDVAAITPDNVWAVGSTSSVKQGQLALIEHWDGKTWSVVSSPQPQGTSSTNAATLWSLDTLSLNDIWAGGDYELAGTFHYLLEHWDGHTWNSVSVPVQAKKEAILHQVDAISDQNIWALDSAGSLLHWNGKTWSSSSFPNAAQNGDSINRISTLPDGQLWLAGTVRDPLGSGPKTLVAKSC